jgi:predicted metal-dependent hydrolase
LAAPVEVRRHPNARRLTLRVDRRRKAVIVTVPSACRIDEARRFLRSNVDWVRDNLGRVPEPVPFADGAKLPLRGRLHRLRFVGPGHRGVVSLSGTDDGLPRLNVAGRIEHAPRRLQDWLLAQAKTDLDERVRLHAQNLRVRVKRISLRDQSSRWGSCSANGMLSFSWRLILAPPFVLDYVAAHEVAHLVEMNHGARFWRLVAAAVPRIEEAKDWLREFGVDLHRYGVEC